MGLLRDMFSKIGFCESTAALDEKPQWVEKLANKTLQSGLVPSDQSYKDRLEMALFQASNYNIDADFDNGSCIYGTNFSHSLISGNNLYN